MKFATNFAAGVGSSAWSAVIGLAVVPFYLKYLGLEAYGIIGFFASLQAVLALLDVGLGPTVNREVARGRSAGTIGAMQDLLVTLSLVYWATAGMILGAIVLAAPYLGQSWLHSGTMGSAVVTQAIMLMGFIAACRWPIGLYLGAAMGAERIVITSAISAGIVTLGNVGAVLVLAFVAPTIEAFFIWQAGVAIFHVLLVRYVTRDIFGPRWFGFQLDALRQIWRFSAGMGIVAVLGTVFMQLDKVLLSKMVSLADLGRYTLAGVVARTLYLFLTPAFSAIYPRLSAMVAQGRDADVTALYKVGTRALLSIVLPLATFVAVFSVDLVQLWTGDAVLARAISPVIALLTLGTALNGVMHFPYALQLAYGRSRLPVLISGILIVGFVPLVLILTAKAGIIGAAAAWAIVNLLYVFVGTWLTHRTLLPRIGAGWLTGDVGMPLVAALLIAGLGGLAVKQMDLEPIAELFLGAVLTAMACAATILASPDYRANSRAILMAA